MPLLTQNRSNDTHAFLSFCLFALCLRVDKAIKIDGRGSPNGLKWNYLDKSVDGSQIKGDCGIALWVLLRFLQSKIFPIRL